MKQLILLFAVILSLLCPQTVFSETVNVYVKQEMTRPPGEEHLFVKDFFQLGELLIRKQKN
jgi:hypothetical protein